MAEYLKILLQKTDLPQDLLQVDIKWMESMEPMKDFLKWIQNCVSDRNCITPQEIMAHRTLSEHDKLLEDESLESTYKSEFTGGLSVVSYRLQAKLFENMLNETQKRLSSINESHKELVESNNQRYKNNQNILLSKANKLLEEEAKRTRALISGDHHKALQNLAESNGNLSTKLRCIADDGSPPGTIGFTNLNHFCHLVEDLKTRISLCTDHFQEEMEKETAQERKSHGEFDTANLSRLFNDSIKAEICTVQLMARIEGVTAALEHLRNDSSSSLELPKSARRELLNSTLMEVCRERMMVMTKRMQVDHATQKRLRKQALKPKMERAVELAKRMKLIGDAMINIAKEERLWVLTCRKLLTETMQALEEEYEDILKCQDNIQKVRTVLDLSVTNHSFQVPQTNASSFIGNVSSYRRGIANSTFAPPVNSAASIRDLALPALSQLKSFEKQAWNALAYSKTLYNGVFRGPTATPESLGDYISTVLRFKDGVEEIAQKWNDLYYAQAVAAPANPIHLLLDKLLLMYLKDPEDFFVVFNRMMGEFNQIFKIDTCLTTDVSLLDQSVG